ncbi:unnamed protein product, partial [Closterium sp. NIES-54]
QPLPILPVNPSLPSLCLALSLLSAPALAPLPSSCRRALSAAQLKPNQEFDVLNGIAWDAQQRRVFVTGKYWPLVFQIAPKTITGSSPDDVAAIRLRCHPQVYRR